MRGLNVEKRLPFIIRRIPKDLKLEATFWLALGPMSGTLMTQPPPPSWGNKLGGGNVLPEKYLFSEK